MRANLEAAGFTKVALRDAVNAADQWAEDNAAPFNTALPSGAGTFRATATPAQKAVLLSYVILTRAGKLGNEGDA